MHAACSVTSAAVTAKSPQSCPKFCDPTDCSPPGCSVHGILQTRILEWVAISSSTVRRDTEGLNCWVGFPKVSKSHNSGTSSLDFQAKEKGLHEEGLVLSSRYNSAKGWWHLIPRCWETQEHLGMLKSTLWNVMENLGKAMTGRFLKNGNQHAESKQRPVSQ